MRGLGSAIFWYTGGEGDGEEPEEGEQGDEHRGEAARGRRRGARAAS